MTDEKATKTETTFKLTYSVACEIDASDARVWELLSDAAAIPRWASTVESLEGKIALGERLALRVPGVDRTFTPRVTRLEPRAALEWSDGFAPMFRGVRTFTLTPRGDGVTRFEMTEVFSGVMLPMIKGSLPDFREAFDAYAADLKRAAESPG